MRSARLRVRLAVSLTRSGTRHNRCRGWVTSLKRPQIFARLSVFPPAGRPPRRTLQARTVPAFRGQFLFARDKRRTKFAVKLIAAQQIARRP
jgi:hypothetical protein